MVVAVQDIQDLNRFILNMGEKFRVEVSQPVGPSPTQFPVNQSFSLATSHLFLTLPQAVQRRLTLLSPEEVAQHGKRLGTKISPLSIWMLGYFFLVGREVLLDLGEISEREYRDEIVGVVDFWHQLSLAHRGDSHLDSSEAGFTNRFLPHALIGQLYQGLVPVDGEMRRLLAQFCQVLEGYLFLLNAEAHLSTVDSGPYPLSSSRVLIVRDFFDLKGRWYPWRETVADLPYATCSLAFTLDPADFQDIEICDRAALRTVPSDYISLIHEIAIVTCDDGLLHSLPFTEMDRLIRSVKKTAPKLAGWFEGLPHRDMILQGALPWALRPFAVVANDEECFAWEPHPQALSLLPCYEDDEARAVRWATHRCLAPKRPSFEPIVS